MIKIIEDKLNAAFSSIQKLEIKDDSHKHQGHAGWREGGNTHFSILIVSDDFEGVPRVKRHQMVYKALEDELKNSIHALAIKALSDKEQK